jgi:hypothetical protein
MKVSRMDIFVFLLMIAVVASGGIWMITRETKPFVAGLSRNEFLRVANKATLQAAIRWYPVVPLPAWKMGKSLNSIQQKDSPSRLLIPLPARRDKVGMDSPN